MLVDMAASVLSAGMSFCASPDESFSPAGHERAFIPSPPRGWITPGRTLCRRLAPGPPVTLVRGPSTALPVPPAGSRSRPQLHQRRTIRIYSWAISGPTAATRGEEGHSCGHVAFSGPVIYIF